MATPKIIADFETQLSTSLAIGGTSFSLASATDDDGVSLPAGLYYFTVDNGTSNKEYLAGTLSGTSVTAVLSVSRQGAETSGSARAHRVGASCILTDFATYMKYMNEISLVSAPDASLTAKGVVEAATTAEVNAGTALGSTGAVIAVAPDKLTASNYGILLASMTGVVLPYAGAAAPSGFLLCDGTAVSRTTYAALFAITGILYGAGDSVTTFNVPNLKGKVPVGLDSAQTEFDLRGESGGAKTHTLTSAEIPAAVPLTFNTGTQDGTGEACLVSVATSGGGGAHNNLQPYIVVNYIIKT